MLVLSRKVGEKIIIGDNVTIVVQRVSRNRVALAIEAPEDVRILRGELSPFGEEGGDALTTKPAVVRQIVQAIDRQVVEEADSPESFVHQEGSDLHSSGDSVISSRVDETVILKRNAPITAK